MVQGFFWVLLEDLGIFLGLDFTEYLAYPSFWLIAPSLAQECESFQILEGNFTHHLHDDILEPILSLICHFIRVSRKICN